MGVEGIRPRTDPGPTPDRGCIAPPGQGCPATKREANPVPAPPGWLFTVPKRLERSRAAPAWGSDRPFCPPNSVEQITAPLGIRLPPPNSVNQIGDPVPARCRLSLVVPRRRPQLVIAARPAGPLSSGWERVSGSFAALLGRGAPPTASLESSARPPGWRQSRSAGAPFLGRKAGEGVRLYPRLGRSHFATLRPNYDSRRISGGRGATPR